MNPPREYARTLYVQRTERGTGVGGGPKRGWAGVPPRRRGRGAHKLCRTLSYLAHTRHTEYWWFQYTGAEKYACTDRGREWAVGGREPLVTGARWAALSDSDVLFPYLSDEEIFGKRTSLWGPFAGFRAVLFRCFYFWCWRINCDCWLIGWMFDLVCFGGWIFFFRCKYT